jgi:hypothetical protein
MMTISLSTTALAAAMLCGTALAAQAHEASRHHEDDAVIVTASNAAAANQLLVYSPGGALLAALPTHGQGGVAGNAGGIAAAMNRVAVVNFGSSNVSVFVRDGDGASLRLQSVFATQGNPVSVAFAEGHLYVLTTTGVESHPLDEHGVRANADGSARLLHADGTAAQVGAIRGQLVITEKSNAIETVDLDADGAVHGTARAVSNVPANVDTPFGLATRGDEAYVTIAHANEISLVRHDTVLAVTGSGTQSAPCWVALDGPFLFSSNSPSKSVSRYAVYGQKIVQDEAVAAHLAGSPTDIAYRAGLLAVIDAAAGVSRVSVFDVDEDGGLGLHGVATIGSAATNGVAIVTGNGKR